MAIYKVKGKKGDRWYVDFYNGGQRIRKVLGSKKDAEDAEALLKVESLQGEVQRFKNKMSFQDLCKEYLGYGRTNGKRSLERDKYSIKALMTHFEHLKINQINPMMIETYKRKRLEEKKSCATVNRELAALKHMFNLARKWKLMRENPMHDVKLFKEEKYEMRILEKVEADLLIDAAVEHLKPIIIVALNSGMRKGEILNLSWNDIDFVKYTIHVKHTKSGKDRILPISSLIAEVLKGQDMSSKWIFPNPQRKDRALKDISSSFKTAYKRCGIEKLRFHDLRHTAATWMVNAGIDLVTIKEILGHSTIQMTMVYCHSSQESKRKAIQELEKLFKSKIHDINRTQIRIKKDSPPQ